MIARAAALKSAAAPPEALLRLCRAATGDPNKVNIDAMLRAPNPLPYDRRQTQPANLPAPAIK